jgi:predicted metal-dependent hydrolase
MARSIGLNRGVWMTMEDSFAEGIHLFNAQKFFEAHETLEIVWLKAAGDHRTFLQGLIQVAAAFHHHTRHNPSGFRSLLEKGCAKLEKFDEEFEPVDLAGLMLQLQPWRENLRQPSGNELPVPPLPRIRLIHSPPRD